MAIFHLKKVKIVPKHITCLLALFFSSMALWNIAEHQSKVGCHCLLFGTIHEKERVFQDGPLPLCILVALTHCAMMILSLYLLFFTLKDLHVTW